MFQHYPLRMAPFFARCPWGGRRLAEVLRKPVPSAEGPYGEAWELSDHPDGHSCVANGPYAGMLFGEVVRRWPRQTIGQAAAPERYPLLIKFIDAATDLSIQVHPDDARGRLIGDRGKSECWFVIDCQPGAEIIHGLQPGVDADGLRRAAQEGTLAQSVRRLPIRPQDFIDLPAGTVHAILGGTLLYEVQQSSNTTYRLWDWDRQPPRPLHLEKACEAARCNDATQPAQPLHLDTQPPGEWQRLVRNDYYEVQTAHWEPGRVAPVQFANAHGLIVSVVHGGGSLELESLPHEPLTIGQTWFLPAGMEQWPVRSGPDGLRLLVSRAMELE